MSTDLIGPAKILIDKLFYSNKEEAETSQLELTSKPCMPCRRR